MKVSSINPYTEKINTSYQFITNNEISNRIDKAHSLFLLWREKDFNYKNNLLKQLIQTLASNINKYAILITNEMGKPIAESIAEIKKCILLCNYYLENSERYLKSTFIDLDSQIAEIKNEPLGVLLGIMPWNFPFWQVFRFSIPSIMAGNSVMIKHAPNTFGCGELISEIFVASGYPKYLFTSLIINHDQVESIIANKKIQAISLTGSDKAGSAVGKLTGKYIKKSLFELGGSDPFIVFPDANVKLAVQDAISAKFLNAGQSCISPKRFFIHENISNHFKDNMVKKLRLLKIGNPESIETDIGPLSKKEFVDKINDQIDKSINLGAKIIYRDTSTFDCGYFMSPIIIEIKNLLVPIFQEEVFGPVVSIYKFSNNDNILDLANDTDFGLGASLWTNDKQIINKFKNNINSGALFINGMTKSDPRIPFGGIKKSGYGRELSIDGIKEFVNVKTIVMNKKEVNNV